MDKRNKTALAYLLIGVAAAGRALLSVPENAAIQEVSLTVLALVGYLLLASNRAQRIVDTDPAPSLLSSALLVEVLYYLLLTGEDLS